MISDYLLSDYQRFFVIYVIVNIRKKFTSVSVKFQSIFTEYCMYVHCTGI